MKTRTFRQSVYFYCPPQDIFEALMSSKLHSEITGDHAFISRKKGGVFFAYGGYIKGKNLEIKKNRAIKQAWRAGDWPQGHFSKVNIALKEIGELTSLKLTHSGIPLKQYDEIAQGWNDLYWDPLRRLLSAINNSR